MEPNVHTTALQETSAAKTERSARASSASSKRTSPTKSRFRKLLWNKAPQTESSSSHEDGGFLSSSSASSASPAIGDRDHDDDANPRTDRPSIDSKQCTPKSTSRKHNKSNNQNNSPAVVSFSPGSDGEGEEEEEDDNDAPDHAKAALATPTRAIRRAVSDSHRASPLAGGKYSWHDDGDYFMSEPSLSEDCGDSVSEPELHSYRDSSTMALVGTKLASDSNGVFKTGAMPLSPPRDLASGRRGVMLSPGTLSRGSFTSSPGNTSLSSKEISPYSRLLHFETQVSAQGEWFDAADRHGLQDNSAGGKLVLRQMDADESQLKVSAGRRHKLAVNQNLALLQTPSLSRDEGDDDEHNKNDEKDRKYPQSTTSPTDKPSGTSDTDDVTPVRIYSQKEHFMTPETGDSAKSNASRSASEQGDGNRWNGDVNDGSASSYLHKDLSSPHEQSVSQQNQAQSYSSVRSPEMLHFMSPQDENNLDIGSTDNISGTKRGDESGNSMPADLNDFLHGLKVHSVGKLTMSGSNEFDDNDDEYANESPDSKALFTIDDEIDPSPRKSGGGGDSSDATQQRTNAGIDFSSGSESANSSPQKINHSLPIGHGDQPDQSISMTLSQSVDEDDNTERDMSTNASELNDDANDRKMAASGHRNEDLSGADDEKTLERPRRKRIYSSGGAPSHRRTRSGDGAAATLMTGGTEWIGMEIDKLPIPPAPSEHDDDSERDDDNNNDDDDQDMVDEERYDEVPQMQQFPVGSTGSRVGMFDFFTKHRRGNSGGTGGEMSAGSAEPSSSGQVFSFTVGSSNSRSPTRTIRRLRQQQKQRQQLKKREKHQQDVGSPGKESDMWVLSDSTVDYDDEPPGGISGMLSPGHSRVLSGGVPSVVERRHRVADSLSTLGGFGPENDNNRDMRGRGDEEDLIASGRTSPSGFEQRGQYSSRASVGEGSEGSSQGSKSSAFSWISSRISVLSGKANNIPRLFSRRNTNTSQSASHYRTDSEHSAFSATDMGEEDSSRDESVSSESDVESYGAESKRAPNMHSPGISIHSSPPGSKSARYPAHKHSPRSEEHPPQPESEKDDSSYARKRQEMESIRKLESHMQSISSAASDRLASSYKPAISVPDDEMDKYPTYICPRCHTRQREFFSVATAPRQFDGPAGYLAFYFAVYVLASLFIFGLEEGWPALECVYFAVITLTTAGLGDYVPTTDGAKIICSVFIYFGVACIGLLLGSLLASSLDDASRKAARENQIENCPNCDRIMSASKTRNPGRSGSLLNSGHSAHFSERVSSSVKFADSNDCSSPGPSSKRFKTEAGYSLEPQLSRITEGTERTVSTDRASSNGNSSDNGRKNRELTESSSELSTQQEEKAKQFISLSPRLGEDTNISDQNSSLNVINAFNASYSSIGYTPTSAASPDTQTQGISPPLAPDSPAPGDVLERQSHTRHMSFDIQNMGSLGGSLTGSFAPQLSTSKARAYSEENAYIHSFSENLTDADRAAATGYSGYPRMQSEATDMDETGSSSTNSIYSDEFEIPREISRVEAARDVLLTLKQAVANSIFIIAIGSVGFYFIERMTAVDSFYFTTVLLTTVGYGDIVPKTSEGKMFATVYVLVAGTVLLHNMSMISMIPLELRKKRIEHAVLTQFGDQLDDAALQELATGNLIRRLRLSTDSPIGLSECTREMFALAMLVRLGRVTARDVRATFAAFQRLDLDGDGKLNSRDIIEGQVAKRRSMLSRQSMLQTSNNGHGSSNAGKGFLFGSLLRPNDAPDGANGYPQGTNGYDFAGREQDTGLSSENSPLLQSPISLMGNGNIEREDERHIFTTSGDGTEQHPLLRQRLSTSSMVTTNSMVIDHGGGTYMSVMPNEPVGEANLIPGPRLRGMSSDSYVSAVSAVGDVEKGYDTTRHAWMSSPIARELGSSVSNTMQMSSSVESGNSPMVRKRALHSNLQNNYSRRDF